MTDWAIPQQSKLKYTQLFNLHDRNRSGFLSGLQCRDILMQSGLPRNILAEIWNLSDIDGDGQLTREEFILAMHLTNHVRSGHQLPAELSADLIPPSYRRTRSVSATSIHSETSVYSSTPSAVGVSNINDDQGSQKSSDAPIVAGSILNSNSFEDKRRENFERGRAELERRRLKMIEQQAGVLEERLVVCKKHVADAKSKIDSMRSERDTRAGLITSLEAQLKTVRDRKAYLDQEELQLAAIAKDLNLINSTHPSELDLQAITVKQESITKMKEKIIEMEKEKDEKSKLLKEVNEKIEESTKELETMSDDVKKICEVYKEKVAHGRDMRIKFMEENKTTTVDLSSVWDSVPTFNSNMSQSKADSPGLFGPVADPWGVTSSSKQFEEPISFNDSKPKPINTFDNERPSTRDYSVLSGLDSQPSAQLDKTNNNFTEMDKSDEVKKRYRALYAFEARNPDELNINPGDIITHSDQVCEPGWLSGELNGKVGLFPEAYVEVLTTSSSQEHLDFPTTTDNSTNDTRAAIETTNPSEQIVNVKFKALYAFDAVNPDELTINPGDIITSVAGPREPGWLLGELNGKRGLVPEDYVERIVEVAQAEQTTEPVGKSRSKKAEVATVIANYRALGQEQLNLEKGQLVLIRRKMDSGWWEGELQIKDEQRGDTSSEKDRSELDHLINELVVSEWDYVNDLRLCQSAYVFPLSNSFDVSRIFINWNQLIQMHENSLDKLSKFYGKNTFDYGLVFETFQNLFDSIVETYIEFCSHQNESTRQLEAKLASDIRCRQIVNESQRKLRSIIEQQAVTTSGSDGNGTKCDLIQLSRVSRNSNLPLTSFLLKPMQRITKYSLIFERMYNVVCQLELTRFRGPAQRLKSLAQNLCSQVNEACRTKGDNEDNQRKLRWCQNHIIQSAPSFEIVDSRASISKDPRPISGSFSNDASVVLNEIISFDSATKFSGQRRILKAGCLGKMKSGREIVAFLFNDMLLLTLVKGGSTLRAEDLFKTERAQQAYFKLYRSPIMLDEAILVDSSDALQNVQYNCASLTSPQTTLSNLDTVLVSLVDQASGATFHLVAMSAREKNEWVEKLDCSIIAAKESKLLHATRLNPVNYNPITCGVEHRIGRLLVSILELRQDLTGGIANEGDSANRRSKSFSEHIHNACIQIQLKRYPTNSKSFASESRGDEIVPLSELFKTKTKPVYRILDSRSSPTIRPTLIDKKQFDVIEYTDENTTQFTIIGKQGEDVEDFMEIELVDDSQFRKTQVIARRRVNMDQLLGFRPASPEVSLLDYDAASLEMKRRSSRIMQALQPDRPTDKIFKLKSQINRQFISERHSYSSSTMKQTVAQDLQQVTKFSVKLRLHFQSFCDNDLI